VITFGNKVIAKAFNQVEALKDPMAHAEMIAVTQATNTIANKWLYGCTMYVTIEPCSMCAGTLVLARSKRLVLGAPDLRQESVVLSLISLSIINLIIGLMSRAG